MQLNVIHRHTGGLENDVKTIITLFNIHRHTGGLENFEQLSKRHDDIHRHTGGLEIPKLSII